MYNEGCALKYRRHIAGVGCPDAHGIRQCRRDAVDRHRRGQAVSLAAHAIENDGESDIRFAHQLVLVH